MRKIRIFDTMFSHGDYLSINYTPMFEWDRKSQATDMAFYTDTSLDVSMRTQFIKEKIAWLVESPLVEPKAYEWIRRWHGNFDKILTFDKQLLRINSKFMFVPYGTTWIRDNKRKINEKFKLCSIVASGKKNLVGQKLRHDVVSRWGDKIDVYGREYCPIPFKSMALADYMFSVAIENAQSDYYFTEKLIDCFLTGTVPIYWGCPSIDKFFNTDGMIIFNEIDELDNIITNLDRGGYDKRMSAIKENFDRALKYISPEDYIAKNILKWQ